MHTESGLSQQWLIDRALVLWDVDTDLIVDVLLDAIPGATSWRAESGRPP
jgi:hypothetical protein